MEPEENGVSLGVRESPAPPRGKRDKQSVLNKGKSGVMKKDQREQSEPFSPQNEDHVINVNYVYCWAELKSCFVSGE